MTTQVVVDTDLSIVKDVSTDEAGVGDEVVYTLRVANAGPSTARAVVVTDPLPSGLRVTGTPEADDGACSVSGRTVTCTLDDLVAGATTEIRVTATVLASAAGESLTNTARVSTASNDEVGTNDQDSAVLSVTAAQEPTPPGTPTRHGRRSSATRAPPAPAAWRAPVRTCCRSPVSG